VPLVFVGRNVELSFISREILSAIPFSFLMNGKAGEMNLDCIFE